MASRSANGMRFSLPAYLQRVELRRILARFDLAAVGAGLLAGRSDARLQVLGQIAECLAGERQRPDGDRVLRHREVRGDLVKLHLLHARSLVLARGDDAVLDGVVDLVVGDDGRRHARRRERRAPDRRALHADRKSLQLFEVPDRPC